MPPAQSPKSRSKVEKPYEQSPNPSSPSKAGSKDAVTSLDQALLQLTSNLLEGNLYNLIKDHPECKGTYTSKHGRRDVFNRVKLLMRAHPLPPPIKAAKKED